MASGTNKNKAGGDIYLYQGVDDSRRPNPEIPWPMGPQPGSYMWDQMYGRVNLTGFNGRYGPVNPPPYNPAAPSSTSTPQGNGGVK